MQTLLLNFSGVYVSEGFRPRDSVMLDLSSLEGSCCYCSEDAKAAIRAALAPYDPFGIHWLDSGDYHYVSYLWMERINIPFDLLLIDNHTDDQLPVLCPDILSCGGWVQTAKSTLPNLAQVHFTRAAELPESLAGPGLPVYVSLDKDALSEKCSRTDWSQSCITLDGLKGLLSQVASHRKLIGFDVCGELSESKGARGEDLALNLETNKEIQNILLNLQG